MERGQRTAIDRFLRQLHEKQSAVVLPVFCGDTIRVETEVVAARLSSSRPGQGIVTFEHFGYNQRDDVICDAVRSALMKTAPS